jgi:hypothetical protein
LQQRKRAVHYGIFVAGLLLAGVSFLVYLGNAMALEGASRTIARWAVLGMVGGSILASAGVVIAAAPRRSVALAFLAGGLAGAAGGWLLGSLVFPGGNWYLEWMVAVCLTPIGMWLGLLAGPGKPSSGRGR